MSSSSRREFLQATSALAVSGALVSPERRRAQAAAPAEQQIPPHTSLPLAGIHAHVDRVSYAPGEQIHVHVCSTLPYTLQICRLGTDVDSPANDEVLQETSVAEPLGQPIHPGSYVHVEQGLSADDELPGLTLESWVRLWDVPGEQAVLTQFDWTQGAGYLLAVSRDGSVLVYFGDGGAVDEARLHRTPPGVLTRTETSPPSVPTQTQIANGGRGITLARWHHVIATCDGQMQRLFIDGQEVASWPHEGPLRAGPAPLRIGAWGRDGLAAGFLDADLAQPTLYSRALGTEEIRARQASQAHTPPESSDGLLACWLLNEERGDVVADCSPQARHGRIVNLGTWMIGGPSFNADIDRFAPYDPAADATRGHGLRLASDDLYDCRWSPSHSFELPADARSGIYAARFHVNVNGQDRLYHALFVMRPSAERPKAPIAFLASTNTWRAYAGTPFCETWPGLAQSIGHAYVNSPGNPPEYSCYWQHRAGQGGYQMGLRMPWPVAGPYTFHQDLSWRCSHLCHADRLTLAWLEQSGYAVDVYSDLDLQTTPDVLDGYQALFIVGHSEYWSAEGYRAVDGYLQQGGSVACLSGNTMFWRVSFSDDLSVMECRKVDAPGAQMPPWLRGEVWHSHDGQRGGMSRECGYPAWKYLGLEYMSVHAVGVEGIGPYRVVNRDHFLFHTPHELQLGEQGLLGEPRGGGLPELIGHEGDVRVSTLAKVCLPLPPGANPPTEDPSGITLLAEGLADWSLVTEGAPWDYLQRPVVESPQRTALSLACEMIYWERPGGGRVFHAGSVSAGRGFANDPQFGLLMHNVLHHFGVAVERPA